MLGVLSKLNSYTLFNFMLCMFLLLFFTYIFNLWKHHSKSEEWLCHRTGSAFSLSFGPILLISDVFQGDDVDACCGNGWENWRQIERCGLPPFCCICHCRTLLTVPCKRWLIPKTSAQVLCLTMIFTGKWKRRLLFCFCFYN